MKPHRNDDDQPDQPDAMRLRLLMRLATIDQRWRRCVIRSCRRARRCDDPALPCAPPLLDAAKRHDNDETLAQLKQALCERVAAQGWE